MILTFSQDKFVDRIKSGIKTHTNRADIHMRWKVGMTIQFWRGNPRNVKNNPYQFGVGIVERIHWITIDPIKNIIIRCIVIGVDHSRPIIITDTFGLDFIAQKDGFDNWEEMKRWFKEPFYGRSIYWKDFKSL